MHFTFCLSTVVFYPLTKRQRVRFSLIPLYGNYSINPYFKYINLLVGTYRLFSIVTCLDRDFCPRKVGLLCGNSPQCGGDHSHLLREDRAKSFAYFVSFNPYNTDFILFFYLFLFLYIYIFFLIYFWPRHVACGSLLVP